MAGSHNREEAQRLQAQLWEAGLPVRIVNRPFATPDGRWLAVELDGPLAKEGGARGLGPTPVAARDELLRDAMAMDYPNLPKLSGNPRTRKRATRSAAPTKPRPFPNEPTPAEPPPRAAKPQAKTEKPAAVAKPSAPPAKTPVAPVQPVVRRKVRPVATAKASAKAPAPPPPAPVAPPTPAAPTPAAPPPRAQRPNRRTASARIVRPERIPEPPPEPVAPAAPEIDEDALVEQLADLLAVEEEGLTTAALGKAVGTDTPTAKRLLEALELQGLVVRAGRRWLLG